MKEFESVDDILDYAISQEQEAAEFYLSLSTKVKGPAMKDVFIHFSNEEMKHKAKLLDIKEKKVIASSFEKVKDLKIADFMVEVVPTDELTYKEAIVIAMLKEKAAFKLYLTLSEKIPNPELKSIFMMLAQEESKHKLRFELEYDEFVLTEN